MDSASKAYLSMISSEVLTEEKRHIKRDVKKAVRELVKDVEEIQEETLSPELLKAREEYVLKLKKNKKEFEEKYGDDWESVLYATATKLAKHKVGDK